MSLLMLLLLLLFCRIGFLFFFFLSFFWALLCFVLFCFVLGSVFLRVREKRLTDLQMSTVGPTFRQTAFSGNSCGTHGW